MKHYDFMGETHRYHYPQRCALHIETCCCHCKRAMGKEMIFKADKCAVFTASLKQSQRHMFLSVKKQNNTSRFKLELLYFLYFLSDEQCYGGGF